MSKIDEVNEIRKEIADARQAWGESEYGIERLSLSQKIDVLADRLRMALPEAYAELEKENAHLKFMAEHKARYNSAVHDRLDAAGIGVPGDDYLGRIELLIKERDELLRQRDELRAGLKGQKA